MKKLPRRLNFLSKFDKISFSLPQYYDLIIDIDCPSVGIGEKLIDTRVKRLSIGDLSKVSASTLLYDFYKSNDLVISKEMAECLYIAVYDYTLAFKSKTTDQRTFSLISELLNSKMNVSEVMNNLNNRESLATFKAKSKIMDTLDLFSEGRVATGHLENSCVQETGVLITDCDDIMDTVLSIGIVNVVAYFRVIDNKVKVSLQSKGNLDVSLITSSYEGRGNINFSEFSITSSDLHESKEKVIKTILNYI
jgi:phosphoesterase RecJ-like protein